MEALDRNMIGFNLRDHNTDFFRSSVFRDIVDIVSFMLEPNNFDLYTRMYYKLSGYVSKAEIQEARFNPQEHSIDKILAIPNLPEYKREILENLKLNLRLAVANFKKRGLDILLNNCGYLEYLKKSKREQSRGLDSLMRIFNTIVYISNDYNIEQFLPRLKYLEQLALNENDSDVVLLSMHSSKGLEFDNVFLIDLIESEIPGNNLLKDDLEEERRLLYVGMTRAKENLFLYAYREDANEKVRVTRFFNDLK